jgi:hypothetical protein
MRTILGYDGGVAGDVVLLHCFIPQVLPSQHSLAQRMSEVGNKVDAHKLTMYGQCTRKKRWNTNYGLLSDDIYCMHRCARLYIQGCSNDISVLYSWPLMTASG